MTEEKKVEENKSEAESPATGGESKVEESKKEEPKTDTPDTKEVDELKSEKILSKGGEKKVEPTPAKSDAKSPTVSGEGEEVKVPAKFKDLVEKVESMSVLELHELVKVLEKKFGVSVATMAVAAPGAGSDDVEEKSSFNVELTDAGGQKIQVIKAIKEVLGLGLKEAKDLMDAAPTILKEGMKKEEAEGFKKLIEEAGGKVELK